MKCEKCGAENNRPAQPCTQCGEPFMMDAATTPPPPETDASKPAKKSRLAKLSLYLAIMAWAVIFFMGLMTYLIILLEQEFFAGVVLFLGFLSSMVLGLASICFGIGAIIQKIFSLITKRASPPLWPAIVGLGLILIPILGPETGGRLVIYFKTGTFLPSQTYRLIMLAQYNEDKIARDLEERHRNTGSYFPWCTIGKRKDPSYDIHNLSPQILNLPTIELSDKEVEQQRLNHDFMVLPAYRTDPFIHEKHLPYAYYSTSASDGATTVSGYIVWSCGPDQKYDLNADNIAQAYNPAGPVPSSFLIARTYDPSNGAASAGDIVRYKGPAH